MCEGGRVHVVCVCVCVCVCVHLCIVYVCMCVCERLEVSDLIDMTQVIDVLNLYIVRLFLCGGAGSSVAVEEWGGSSLATRKLLLVQSVCFIVSTFTCVQHHCTMP